MDYMRATLSVLVSSLALMVTQAAAQEIDWKAVDAALGRSASISGDVHRYGFPRSDLEVTLDGVAIKPAFALGGFVAFKPMHGGTMIMGDLVLLETEVNPVMTKLLDGGVEVTAVHNHLLRARPATFYMHVGGLGDPVKLAGAIRDAVAMSKTPVPSPGAVSQAPPIDLDTGKVEEIMGAKGQVNGGVLQFGIPRRDAVTDSGTAIPTSMGSANAINFQPTGGGKAAITGDFDVTGDEVTALIRTLQQNRIEVTAIHSHMLDEQPRVFFVHFWANDDAIALAKGLRAALDKTAVAKG
jgi:hypothetical protein